MDVGLTVGDIGFLIALFAVMSWLSLSVELGDPPKVRKSRKPGKAKTAEGEDTELEKTVVSTNSGLADGLAQSQLSDTRSGLSLDELRASFVDGYSGPRLKYDVALTVLYECQNAKIAPHDQDQGMTMATEAFTNATQSLFFPGGKLSE
ncbi:MAG: hypothetical protein IPM23_20505 [Candidatus Melainabacteria bacterium]|nr:hypothetical protein [Candidatus Melainabacteria bacterium]